MGRISRNQLEPCNTETRLWGTPGSGVMILVNKPRYGWFRPGVCDIQRVGLVVPSPFALILIKYLDAIVA